MSSQHPSPLTNSPPFAPCWWVVTRLFRFVAGCIAAILTWPLLNRRKTTDLARDRSTTSDDLSNNSAPPSSTKSRQYLAGRTLDLTLLAAVRAFETLVRSTWTTKTRKRTISFRNEMEQALAKVADPLVFVISAGIVMWAWIYSPERLPRSYNRWISSAAEVDPRLLSVLRHARRGEWVYGKDSGKAQHVLDSMCTDYGWPIEWGDPGRTIPIPCEMVHMGAGPNCHVHAAKRFMRAFRFAFAMYLPLQIAVKAPRKRLTVAVLRGILRESIRSSAFLGAFISLFYYSVCLTRTVLLPRLVSRKTITPMMIDGGLCVGAGCAACGWSILVEKGPRRQELAFFVAPRALATLLPRRYDIEYAWRERLVFGLSIGVLFAQGHQDSGNVRGVMGRLLHGILHEG